MSAFESYILHNSYAFENFNAFALTLTGHSDSVTSVSFSPDDKIIASASEDGKVILWNLHLDDLLARGCQWLQDYFVTHPAERNSLRPYCNYNATNVLYTSLS